jgi:hypothetical protein
MAKPDMFLALLLESGLHVLAVETPNASPFVLQSYAAAAEEYRRQWPPLISGNKPDGLPGALAELEALIQRPYTATRLFRSRLACFVTVIILLLHP